jgi:AcrR family transcriptional regulator
LGGSVKDRMPETPVAGCERRVKRDHPRRDEILERAEALIREHRLHNVTLRGLARSMNVSATALYEYFADKQELLSALYDRATHRMRDAFREGDDASRPIDERVRGIGLHYFRFGLSEAGLFLFLFDRPREEYGAWAAGEAGTPEESLKERRPAFIYTVSVLESARESFRPDFQAVNAAVELWALLYGFVALSLNHQFPSGIDAEGLVDRAVTHLLAGWHRPSTSSSHLIASGVSGEPTAPVNGSGGATKRNS